MESFGAFRKLHTPAAPHPGQALLGAAESSISFQQVQWYHI